GGIGPRLTNWRIVRFTALGYQNVIASTLGSVGGAHSGQWTARPAGESRRTSAGATGLASLACGGSTGAYLTRRAIGASARDRCAADRARKIQPLGFHSQDLLRPAALRDRGSLGRDVAAVDISEVILSKPTPLLDAHAGCVVRIAAAVA